MLKAVLFDMDGVLVDSELFFYETERRLLEELGHHLTKEYYKQFVGSSCEYMWNKFKTDYELSVSTDYLDRRGRELLDVLVKENGGFPEVPFARSLVKGLKGKYRLAVASSSSMASIERNMNSMNISDCFDKFVSGMDLERTKPAPDIFLLAAKELGVKPEECIVIEDSCNGVTAAKAAGMVCIGYVNENSGNQDLSKADYLVTSFEGIDGRFLDMVYCHANKLPWHVMDTERLSVWEMSDEDTQALREIIREEECTDFSEDSFINNIEDDEFVRAYKNNMYAFYGYGIWTLKEKNSSEIIGFAGIDESDNIGYIIKKNYRNNGFAKEAAAAIVRYMFEEIGVEHIYARIDASNKASEKVAESAGFFKSEGYEELWKIGRQNSI